MNKESKKVYCDNGGQKDKEKYDILNIGRILVGGTAADSAAFAAVVVCCTTFHLKVARQKDKILMLINRSN